MALHIHFVGIKGTGMSALAQISAQIEGATISGSDVEESFYTDSVLKRANIPVLGFSPSNVEKANLVVTSAAYTNQHPEIARALELNIPVLSYPQYLGRLLAKKRGICVTGTHGKTTTTAMMGLVMLQAGLDPTIVVGSDVPSIGGNAHSGKGEFFLAESCEYRRHFLNYTPEHLIITNIEFDHPDYFKDLEDVMSAFAELALKVPEHGHIYVWDEDPNRQFLKSAAPITTFGISESADIRATEILFKDEKSSMKIMLKGKYVGDLDLHVAGRHNIVNALATIALCHEIGIPMEEILSSLSKFNGTKRRFEHIGSNTNGALIVDDYAHHPTEIRTTLEGARLSFPDRRIRAIFQPHTFSRTEKLLLEFSQAFEGADEVVIADIFASARELEHHTVSAPNLAEMILQQGVQARYIGTLDDIKVYLNQTLAPEDLVLTLGAGDIYKVGLEIVS
ncbi:UDP-N-acetylmuramate--L-alanine ligase [Desulfosporosinus sp.]|uniref:UDP-N-acetylmuramate--L-alanine ligase n=1 Tax=Desulfosporosinus sp. TaxID=157907 RepID=UPI0025B80D5A|nr:UDP-N-acetylmuramate--L-alanine ligase [Desulfosporosinus sp.]MBC2721229.1 UDP-N-acetylmuramate--L-alanine ligase [Desulfosporosinus sp.]MBC2728661.1 UDP-N-acetylmuramate--L-alanine ligase [Desulfosporosinus sp.]